MNEYDDLLGGANEYDAQLQVDGERSAKQSALRTSLFGAVRTNPDQFAEAKRVGAAVGVPPDIAVRNLDSVKQRAQLNEYDQLVETAPKLADKLTNPDFAKLAHDDTPQLGTLERLANSFKRGFTSTLRGADAQVLTESAEILNMLDRAERGLPPDASAGRYGSLIAGASGSPENIKQLRLAQQQRLAENALDFARRTGTLNAIPTDPGQDKLRQMGESYGFLEGTLPQFLFGGDAIGTAVNTVAESLSGLAPSLPLIVGSGAVGGARALASATGLTSFGTEYVNDLAGILTELRVDLNDEAAVRAAVASPEFALRNQQALVKAGVIGTVDALTAGVGGARLASGAAANLAAQTGVQAAGGAAGEALGSVASGQEVDPTAVLLEAIGEGPTAVIDAAALAANRVRQRGQQADRAEQNAEVTRQIVEASAENKLRERDPEAFQQFLQSVAEDGPVSELYVDGQALAEAAQAAGVDIGALLPSVAEQIGTAVASGGDVRIPLAEFAARLPGTGLEQSLLPLVKTDPDGLTQAQAQEFRAAESQVFEQEVTQVSAEQAAEKQRREAQSAIEGDIYNQLQLVGRFSPSVNRTYATVTAQFYDTLAQRTGIPAAELAQRYPLSIRGPEQGGASVLDQLAYHGTPHLFDEFKTDRIGTGEGAQAFGYGLYFAENREVAEGYKTVLAPSKQEYFIDGKPVTKAELDPIKFMALQAITRPDSYDQNIVERFRGMGATESRLEQLQAYMDELRGRAEYKETEQGNLYTVDIPDEVVARMLDWDKPLSEQPVSVQAALRDATKIVVDEDNFTAEMAIGSQIGYERFDRTTGAELYSTLGDRLKRLGLGGDREVSAFLDSIGIPGIRYLDAGSRADGDGSRNLVVFNDQNVRVVDRNGQPVNRLEQNTNAPRATISFTDDITQGATIALLENADLSSYNHELAHFFLEVLNDISNRPDAPPGVVADMDKVLEWFGITGDEQVGGEQGGTLEQPGTAAFDRWFGDSKVVDAEGKPLVVYHGTSGDFSEFAGGITQWASTDPSLASAYADHRSKDGPARILPLYMRAEKPFDSTKMAKTLSVGAFFSEARKQAVDAGRTVDDAKARELLKRIKDSAPASTFQRFELWNNTEQRFGADGSSAIKELLEMLGFDSIRDMERGVETFGVFRPEQIKSAIGNRGTFDPASPNILEQSDGQSVDNGPLPTGRTPREVWNAMSLEQRRQYHEQFARGFEAYLFEGKAPSRELRDIFRRFAAWMKNVYRQLTALRVTLSDEVRGVYDRLLATDDAIRAEQRVRGFAPLVEDGQPVGDAPLEGEATDDATERLAKRSLRDMQWLTNARSAALRRLQKQGAEQRKEVRREVEAEVRAMPVYAVQRFLKRGEVAGPDGADVQVTVGNKLMIDDVQRIFGEDTAWRSLGFGKYGMLAKEGLTSDVVAEMFGFPTGEVMVRQILAAAPEREMIEGMTDQRVLERYGDVSSPDALSRAANEELSNDAHLRFLATELAALRASTGKPSDLAAAARLAATRSVGSGKVKDIRPRQYIAAEGRAARKAEQALASGDRQQAARHKREQLLSVALARESFRTQEEVDKALRSFARMFDGKDADVAKRRDLDLVKAARAILGRYGLGPPSDKSVQYLAYVEKYDPGLYAVLKPVLDGALQGQDYRELSVDDFRAVRDAVQSLWTQSKRAKQAEIDGQMVDREVISDALVTQLDQLGGKRYLSENRTSTGADETRMILLGFKAALRRVESFVDSLDQGKPDGPWRKYVWQPISDGAARYRLAKLEKLKAYREALDKIAPTLTLDKIAAPELNGFVFEGGKQEVLHAMLHSGNQSNLNKLVAGYRWGEIGDDGIVDARKWWAFLDRMNREGKITKADWDFVQSVWDLLESTKVDTQAAFKDMYGMYFAEVTAQPVQTPFGTYRGGYVPAKTDSTKVAEAQKNEESILKDGNDMYAFPSTGSGFTKARVEEYTRELQLDLRQIASHLDWVLRFTYIQPRVLDVYRTVNDRRVRSALGEVAPRALEETLTPWLSRTALQMVEKPWQGKGGKGAQRALNYLRRTASMQLMAINVVNALQNFANVPVLALKVPPQRIAAALITVSHSPSKTAKAIAEKSEFMRTRLDSQVMDVQRAISDTVLNPSKLEKVRDWAAQHGHFLSLATQNMLDLVAWTAAYDDATAKGMTELEAVRFADSVARQTQGSLAPEDVSAFEASNAFVRVFTMFYSFFNTQANLLGTEFTKSVRELGLRVGAGRALWVYTFGLLLPAVLGELIAQSLRGQLDLDGEDDDEPLLGSIAFTLESQAKYATAMVPGIGQLAVATMNAFNSKPYDDRIGSSPAVSALEAAVRTPKDVYEVIANDKEIGRRDVKDVLTLIGLLTGTPAAVLARPIGYQIDVDRGSTAPTGPLDYTRGLITGNAPR